MKQLSKILMCCVISMCLLIQMTIPVLAAPEIDAPSYVLIEASTGQIILEKNPTERRSPASITKIMTLLVIFDELAKGNANLTDEVMTSEYAKSMGGSQVFLETGEVQTLDTMIKCIAVASGNDASVAVAEHIAGSEAEFVNMMNAKAQELGCKDTVYTNCTGIHDPNMRTTARDVLRIALYAYTNSNYMAMSSETSHVSPATNKRKERTLNNRNYIVSTQYYTKYYNSLAKGMSSGNTKEGGYCLVTSIRRQGCTYLVVCMNSYFNEEENYVYSYRDCEVLVDWAYNNYNFVSVVDDTTMICEMPVTLSSEVDYVTLLPEHTIEMFLPKDIDIDTAIQLNWILFSDKIEAPIKEGEIAGVMTVKYDDDLVASVNLVTKGAVSRSEFLYFLTVIRSIVSSRMFFIGCAAAAVIAVLYVFFTAVYREKARRRAARRQRPDLRRKR